MKMTEMFLMLATFVGGIFYQQQITVQPIQVLTPAQKAVLDTLEIVYLDDCVDGPGYKTLRVKEANLQVVAGSTPSTSQNGVGNVIIGWNEQTVACEDRSGWHNLIVGYDIDYNVNDSILHGVSINAISGGTVQAIIASAGITTTNNSFNAVIAADSSIIDESLCAIVGGTGHSLTSQYGVILGGEGNIIDSSLGSFILGGVNNHVTAFRDGIVGGSDNTAAGLYSVIIGGSENTTEESYSVVVGGNDNHALKPFSSVFGGQSNNADYDYSSILGGFDNLTEAGWTVVTGGRFNTAVSSADYSVVSGGNGRSSVDTDDWVGGSLLEDN